MNQPDFKEMRANFEAYKQDPAPGGSSIQYARRQQLFEDFEILLNLAYGPQHQSIIDSQRSYIKELHGELTELRDKLGIADDQHERTMK